LLGLQWEIFLKARRSRAAPFFVMHLSSRGVGT